MTYLEGCANVTSSKKIQNILSYQQYVLLQLQYIKRMLRTNQFQIEQKPRKRVKLDMANNEQYNQFKGQAIQEEINLKTPVITNIKQPIQSINFTEQIKSYSKIFLDIKKNPYANRKIQKATENKKQQAVKTSINQKNPQKQLVKKEQKQTKEKIVKKQKVKVQPSSNWKKFLSKEKEKQQSHPHTQSKNKSKYQFVAIDCQFVKSGQVQCLARVSLVNQHGQQLYDSYVKPNKKITDYVTAISGITFAHIKNAPSQDEVIPLMKNKMMNKIIIGHTVDKDLTVCGMKDWKGFKQVIDIADAHIYSPGGKRLALKRLSYNQLGKVIQEGWHSSLEDANVTMQLFLKNKQQILKERKIVKS